MNRILVRLFILFAAQLQTFAAGISETTNGVYLVIDAAWHVSTWPVTNKPIRFDDRLVWMTFCDTGKIELSVPDIRYGTKNKNDQFGRQRCSQNFARQTVRLKV
jgi:hypothetical protein